MKIRKVLFSLFGGLFVAMTGMSMAQNAAGSKIVEIGPDNVGGRVTSMVIDKSDSTNQTIYAGAASGGLYVRNNAGLNNLWNNVPCVINGEEVVLPISCMVQGSDNMIYIGTGEGCFVQGSKNSSMSPAGRGIYRFNPADQSYTLIPTTETMGAGSEFSAVNKLAIYEKEGVSYFFAATNSGLYRWEIRNESDWESRSAYSAVFSGEAVYDVAVVGDYNMVYFSTENKLYRVGNVTANTDPVDVSSSNATIFPASAKRIYIAVAPSNPSYVYAMVVNGYGLLHGVYMTKNQSTWTTLTTSTTTPFTSNSGQVCGAIAVDPYNPSKVYVAGTSVWVGEGFVDGALYQWTKASSSENEFGSGNYMADIFSNAAFVHSGINQIVYADGPYSTQYFLATNGGVFMTETGFNSYININRGLNIAQINGLAVSTDGSLIAGASNSANLFIESRMGHSGGHRDSTWYDPNTSVNTNHMANIIWKGNGGQVAASMFQQYAPATRRTIFTSANNGQYGRAYSDYSDYTNTQTWTADTNFMGAEANEGNVVAAMALWETYNNTEIEDNISFSLDTLGIFYFEGERTRTYQYLDPVTNTYVDKDITLNGFDTMFVGNTIKAGDSIWVASPGHADYPFAYVFEEDHVVTPESRFTTINPIQNRLFVSKIYEDNTAMVPFSRQSLAMTWMPSDFRKVCGTSNPMYWANLYTFDQKAYPSSEINAIAVSNDGDCVVFAVNDHQERTSRIIRVKGINTNVDYSADINTIATQLSYGQGKFENDLSTVVCDTLLCDGNDVINRMVSSLTFDPHAGTDRVIATFDGYYTYNNRNVVVIENASSDSYAFVSKSLPASFPAYSAMVEYTTGNVYVGTEEGIFIAEADAFNGPDTNIEWSVYGNFKGVPVTSIVQQIHDLPQRTFLGHTGINPEQYVFPRTKYPYAIYYGTYGRGIFMDSTYVTNHDNEIVDSEYYIGVPVINSIGVNAVKVYPNPASGRTNLELTINQAGNAQLCIYDLSGKMVRNENLGKLAEGEYVRTLDLQNLPQGMYLINVRVGKNAVASKLIVR